MKTQTTLDNFTRAFLQSALWSSHDGSTPQGGEPMDRNYTVSDFAPEAIERAVADCAKFQSDNADDLSAANIQESGDTPSRAGFLFWLNRNGHGTGFWDEKTHRDTQEEQDACDRLSDACKKFPELSPYIGDDNQIYFS